MSGEWFLAPVRRPRRSEFLNKGQHPGSGGVQKRLLSTAKAREQLLVDRCPDCNAVLERYDEDTISLGIICMSTFIYREPALAAPLLPDMLKCVARWVTAVPSCGIILTDTLINVDKGRVSQPKYLERISKVSSHYGLSISEFNSVAEH